ncbi:8564_t:CDS:2 [Scutellospora calospora]|uniref:8564_t:CDS:1 n=1 Tax=Scutellospora calospora TaxID=85575 RepID=A0ACA9LT30_9GLOM|nr:8564_t:CDS:2 [Scutellospora calospora]
MNSQESSSSFQKNTYTDKSDIIGTKDVCQVIIKKNEKNQKCEKEYVHDNLTSNMITHLRLYNIVNSKKLKSDIQQKRQTTLLEMVKTNTPHKDDRRKEIIRGVVE